MRDKKAKGDDDLPEDMIRLVGDDGLRIMTQLINNIHESGDWPKDCMEVSVSTLKKKPSITKYSNYGTYSKNISEDS